MGEQILQYGCMPLDDLVLGLQGAFDRLIRRLRLGAPPVPGQRRLLIVQIDGLSRAVLEDAITRGRVPFLARLLHRRGYQMVPMCAGLPTGAGLIRAASLVVVIAWVLVKGTVASTVEVTRALLRMLADPATASTAGWKWLAIKLGISVWLRELFTLAVAHDIYAGVPTIYVNYLDYDIAAHAWGPSHGRALQKLRKVDTSIKRLRGVL